MEKYPQRLVSRSSRAIFYRERLGWHIQNLNELPDGSLGPIWKHGRIWFLLGKPHIQLYWSVGGRFCLLRMGLGAGDGQRIDFSLGIPFVGLFGIYFDKFLSDRWMPGRMVDSTVRPGTQFRMVEERQIGVDVIDGRLGLSLWNDPWKWSNSDPRWWRMSWAPLDTFLGRTQYSTREIETTDEVLHLPERDYAVSVRMFESTWKRPRWPRARGMMRAEVTAKQSPILYHAGKGENSWDMDDDLVFSLTLPAISKQDALDKTTERILKDRKRYGEPSTR